MTQKKHTPVSALVFVFCLSPGRVFDITSVQQPTLKSRISCSGHTYRKYAQDSFPLSALPWARIGEQLLLNHWSISVISKPINSYGRKGQLKSVVLVGLVSISFTSRWHLHSLTCLFDWTPLPVYHRHSSTQPRRSMRRSRRECLISTMRWDRLRSVFLSSSSVICVLSFSLSTWRPEGEKPGCRRLPLTPTRQNSLTFQFQLSLLASCQLINSSRPTRSQSFGRKPNTQPARKLSIQPVSKPAIQSARLLSSRWNNRTGRKSRDGACQQVCACQRLLVMLLPQLDVKMTYVCWSFGL